MRTMVVGLACLIVGTAIPKMSEQLNEYLHPPVIVQASGYTPADTSYDYGSSYSYDSYDYSYPCTDAIVLPDHEGFCKEDQEIGTLVEQMRRVNTRFLDPGQSVLFWRFTPS